MKRYSFLKDDPRLPVNGRMRVSESGHWVKFEDFVRFKFEVLGMMGNITNTLMEQALQMKKIVALIKAGDIQNGPNQMQ